MINNIRLRVVRCAAALAAVLVLSAVTLGRAHWFTAAVAGALVSLADLVMLTGSLKRAMSVYRRQWSDFLFKNPFLRFAGMGATFWLLAGAAGMHIWGIACGLIAGLIVSVCLIGSCLDPQGRDRERRQR